VSAATRSTVTIRWAERGDELRIAEIDDATWSPLVSPGPRPTDGAFFRPHVEPSDTLVALVDDAIVGYVLIGNPTPLPASAHVQMIRGLAVAPGYQGRGIGRTLVDAAIEEAPQRGAAKVTLRVLDTNEGA
jgi:ribosomal protein S18 acetylase RimI-like enzyme